MKIIYAGFPKTGTKSMASALRQLGYTVNDFPEHLHGGLSLIHFLRFKASLIDLSFGTHSCILLVYSGGIGCLKDDKSWIFFGCQR